MQAMIPRILVVDDEKLVRWGLRTELERSGYIVDEATDAGEALEQAAREPVDLVLLDYKLPDRSGIEVLRSLRKSNPRLPVIMITAQASVGGAVEAMKEGAYDYLSKPFEIDEVLQCVERAVEAARLREEVARTREQVMRGFGLTDIVSESASMKEVVRMVRRVAASEASTVLLLGESGVGKGLVSRALHLEGATRDKPFLNITCTSLTESLLESELFGHEKGAFTDAKLQKRGLFELADGGTVLLDEIGDISLAMQGKLLRFLEEKVLRRVGGTRDIRVSVRIIAATNKNLEREVEAGRFRRDLYYRLRVIPIVIPPLRERVEDTLALAYGFLRHFNQEFHKSLQGFTPAAESLLCSYAWPGNVRELRNAIERAVLLAESPTLGVEDLPHEIAAQGGAAREADPANGHVNATGSAAHVDGSGFVLPRAGLVFEELEKDLLRQALERARGNRTRAAALLGINRDQIRYRIQKFGLEDPAHDAAD